MPEPRGATWQHNEGRHLRMTSSAARDVPEEHSITSQEAAIFKPTVYTITKPTRLMRNVLEYPKNDLYGNTMERLPFR